MGTQEPNDSRLAPFLICGLTCGLLAIVAVAARSLYAATGVSALFAGVMAVAVCGWVASRVRDRARAWRWLWLAVSLLVVVAAWQVFFAFVGTPSEMATQTRSENAMGLAFFVLMGDFLLGLIGPAVLLFVAAVALFLAWLLGRPKRQRKVAYVGASER